MLGVDVCTGALGVLGHHIKICSIPRSRIDKNKAFNQTLSIDRPLHFWVSYQYLTP